MITHSLQKAPTRISNHPSRHQRCAAFLFALFFLLVAAGFLGIETPAQTTDISGPAGSGRFGTGVTVLPNGNIVVMDPQWDSPGGPADVGAVYLYDGASLNVISMLTGTSAGDQIGSRGITLLQNGNFLILSQLWDNGPAADAGAVTWCSQSTGCGGSVSSNNSLVGGTAGDQVSSGIMLILPNGKYVVGSPNWDSPTGAADVGAATFCGSEQGCTGVVGLGNSLIGSATGDRVGPLLKLSNANYVAGSSLWDNPSTGAVDAGAATWCNGNTGCNGVVSTSNSFVGGGSFDNVGSAIALTNGNYVLITSRWDNPQTGAVDAGAVTLCNGAAGCTGSVSTTNSLFGTSPNDGVGDFSRVIPLRNGNFVVSSSGWDNVAASALNAGAVTFCNGVYGCIGAVTSTNSLVGTTSGDQIGDNGYAVVGGISNGSYVVGSPRWTNPSPSMPGAGALTFCSGSSGCSGPITAANSLIGGSPSDSVGEFTVLPNGNYVSYTRYWNNNATGVPDVGAVTWCSGTTGCTGAITSSNSLVGTKASDRVGWQVLALTNGNYVATSPQ